MPLLELTKEELIVNLSGWEALAAFQGTIRIPLAHVRGATEDEGFRGGELGLRAPGTGIPGMLSAGTYYKSGDSQFAFITRGTHPVVIELKHEKWDRLVLGVDDPRQAAAEINAAVSRVQ